MPAGTCTCFPDDLDEEETVDLVNSDDEVDTEEEEEVDTEELISYITNKEAILRASVNELVETFLANKNTLSSTIIRLKDRLRASTNEETKVELQNTVNGLGKAIIIGELYRYIQHTMNENVPGEVVREVMSSIEEEEQTEEEEEQVETEEEEEQAETEEEEQEQALKRVKHDTEDPYDGEVPELVPITTNNPCRKDYFQVTTKIGLQTFFQCSRCKTPFASESPYDKHKEQCESKIFKYKCSLCDRRFLTYTSNHYKSCARGKVYTCYICKHTTLTFGGLNSHLQEQHF